jgi:hypothetical protein
MAHEIKLDGRTFHVVSHALTANQDDYILAHLRLGGAMEVLNDVDGVVRNDRKRAEDLLTNVMLRGKTHHILAGCLTEEGKTWTREEADANAKRFTAITDLAEKIAMRTFIASFVARFFLSGEASSETSPKSSSRNGKARVTSRGAGAISETLHK